MGSVKRGEGGLLPTCCPQKFHTFCTLGSMQMEANVQQLLLAIAILSGFSAAACALVAWRLASRSTPSRKSPPSPPPTQTSDAALAQLQADQASLFSTLEKLTTTVKRLSSRNGMRELREERQTPAAPPVGASKVQLLRHYGMAGKVGPEFARAQLEREHNSQ